MVVIQENKKVQSCFTI